MALINLPSPLEKLEFYSKLNSGIEVFMKRDDLIHPDISGNKWRKLKYNLEEAKLTGATTLISAGGPWSNHLAALAAAGPEFGYKTVGVIRGVKPDIYSDTLKFCESMGMELIFMSKPSFDRLPESISQIASRYPDSFFIPLGGDNARGIKGCAEIATEITIKPDIITVPVGTGTTMRGISEAFPGTRIIGFSALKSPQQHSIEFNEWLNKNPYAEIIFQPEFGGFAKTNDKLNQFIISFHAHTNIVLEPVYTGKMMFGLYHLIQNEPSFINKTIISIHTGGLQGLKGFPDLHKLLFTS